MEAYKELSKVFTRMYRLSHASSILGWDQSVNMPSKGAASRVAAMSELAVIKHQLINDQKLGNLFKLAKDAAAGTLSADEAANLREMEREWTSETKLPESLVEQLSSAKGNAETVWRTARHENDWEKFKPLLAEVIKLTKEEAKLLQQGTDLSPYEALLDKYEPGLRVATIDRLFNDLKTWLPELIQKTRQEQNEAAAKSPIIEPIGPFDTKKQKECGEEVMKVLGFDFDQGRLDISAHPFCGGVSEDVRLTTRYYEEDLAQGLYGIVHETGHSMYEQNRPQHCLSLPGSNARSMGIHESQSLFFEMQVGRGLQFQKYLTPLLKKHFPDERNEKAFEPVNLFRFGTVVKPDYIRVDADEMTYPMHVILRYEIETALIEGTATVDDIPDLWASKMKEYLGVDTATTGPDGGHNYKDGCMQDIHWSMGYFGYFPTYTLGAMYAAQWMAAMRKDLGDAEVDRMIEAGDYTGITAWLKERVWSKGSLLTTDELVQQGTGETLNAVHLRTHLEKRYS